jgi:hypothetical protein
VSKKIPDRRAAIEGEKFLHKPARHEAEMPRAMAKAICEPTIGTVAPRGPGNDGRWYCLSCGELLLNNLEKDLHCDRRQSKNSKLIESLGEPAKHVLGWFSHTSGTIEVP